MNTRDAVFSCLLERQGAWFSGEELALRLGLSRAAVWKAVQALRDDGCPIVSSTRRGYRLEGPADRLSPGDIAAHLPGGAWMGDITVYGAVDSTNAAAQRLALAGAPSGTAVLAEEQTGGRGRMGRDFYSPRGKGVYLSVVLRPALSCADALLLTSAAAVAVCRAIEAVADCAPQIKWVNDILIGGRKVCGILTEAAADLESGAIAYIVVGAGVNFYRWSGPAPEGLADTAASLEEYLRPGATRSRLAAAMLEGLIGIAASARDPGLLREVRARSAVLGRQVEVSGPQGAFAALAEDIGPDGGLVVRRAGGERLTLRGGSVRLAGQMP